jgi:hypothetical protein
MQGHRIFGDFQNGKLRGDGRVEIIFLIIVIIMAIFAFKRVKDEHSPRQKIVQKKPFVYVVPATPNISNKVDPDNTPLLLRRGWKQEGNRFSGYYRTRYGAWKGLVEPKGDIFKVFIFYPPTEKLKHHPRWICMHHCSGSKWRIDLAINPKDRDVGAIIFFVENMIIDSFKKS